MIDKLNNINLGNTQNKRVSDEVRAKETNIKVSKNTQTNPEKTNDEVQISSELKVKDMSADAPIDSVKVSAIKEAIARGDYPVDLDKVADALLQAYSDIK
jgi:flagellar biosynthesis anti-sigma factor FlgM